MRSIELHWLWKREKWLPLPDLRIVNKKDVEFSCYCAPEEVWRMPWGEQVFTKNGLIVIKADIDEYQFDIDTTLAHEWRHHHQYHSGWNFSGYKPADEDIYNWNADWEVATKSFFLNQVKKTPYDFREK